MNRLSRTIFLAVSVTLSAAAFAQAPATGANPAARGDNVFYYAPLDDTARSNTLGNPLANSGIGRPNPRGGAAQVTPVPEPSQWAMMLAGLALVGFMVRRNSKRS